MDTMEKRTLAFFGHEDRFETMSLLVEYLHLTEDKERQDAILNVIQRLTMFRDEETIIPIIIHTVAFLLRKQGKNNGASHNYRGYNSCSSIRRTSVS